MCVCVSERKVRGKGRPVDHHGLKGKVLITLMNYGCSSMSCILLCLHDFFGKKSVSFLNLEGLFMCTLELRYVFVNGY